MHKKKVLHYGRVDGYDVWMSEFMKKLMALYSNGNGDSGGGMIGEIEDGCIAKLLNG